MFIFVLLAASAVVGSALPSYSFNPPVGSSSGTPYVISGNGRITALRVWERNNNYITGIQFRYGPIWTPIAGYTSGSRLQEFELWDDETIIQVSGKYTHYVQSLTFVTNCSRSLHVGQPSGYSFNMYPINKKSELVIISGTYHGAITSFGTHWAFMCADPLSGSW